MCGFIGIINKNLSTKPISDESIKPLLYHRGPDDYKVYTADNNRVSLHFFRLSILDLELGAQPLSSDDGKITSVFNGEIYNYQELREHLISKGIKLKTNGDAEVIPNLYKLYGKDFVDHLKGMFTILIWDGNEVTAYRDRLGIKPLYYAQDDERIIFSSEVRPLHKLLNITKDISKEGLADYLRYGYVLSNNSIFEDIHTVAPATEITISKDNTLNTRTYWDIFSSTQPKKIGDATKELDIAIEDAVKSHLASDVPVGIYLSGGLDSGVIAAKCAKYNKDIKAFTLKFKESPIDESVVASDIAKEVGLDHKVIEVSSDDLLKLIPTSVWSMEQPLADSGTLANLFITKEARKDGIKVVLCGAGGDEIFGGYTYHVKTDLEKKISPVSIPMTMAGKIIGGEFGRKLIRTASFDRNPLLHYLDKTRVFHNLDKFTLNLEKTEDDKASWFKKNNSDHYVKRLYADLHTYIPSNLMLLLDRATMNYSVEGRLPLLDHELIETALSVDTKRRHPNGLRKGLLKEICKKYLPESVFNLPKVGFNSPVQQWMDGDLGIYIDKVLSSDKFKNRPHFNDKKIESFLSSSLNFHQKWTLFQLELFYRIHIDNDFSNPEEITLEALI